MREKLEEAIKEAIVFECQLPHEESSTKKSCLTARNDDCYNNSDKNKIAKIIYNGIVEYATNEYKIDYENLLKEQRKAILTRIRYNKTATESTKLKYGFYGEVLFDLILRIFYKTFVLVSRGYFYSPLDEKEVPGFDCFHLIKAEQNIELWFGEAKFHKDYKKAIGQVIEKLRISLSDDYLDKNLKAIIVQNENWTTDDSKLRAILDAWKENPDIKLSEEVKKFNFSLVYPVFIAYEKKDKDDYYESIKNCISYIEEECKKNGIEMPATFKYRIFFIFLPLSKVKSIKESVIKWIEMNEPLI